MSDEGQSCRMMACLRDGSARVLYKLLLLVLVGFVPNMRLASEDIKQTEPLVSPSLISLMVYVDVKHHVYLLTIVGGSGAV